VTTTHAEGWRRHRPGAGSPFCAAQRAKRRRQHSRRQAVRRLDDEQAAAHRGADRLGVPAVANVRPRTHRNSLGHYLARLSRSSSLAQCISSSASRISGPAPLRLQTVEPDASVSLRSSKSRAPMSR